MVGYGFKMDYIKDMIFNILNLLWFIYGEAQVVSSIFVIAGKLDQPIACLQTNRTAHEMEILDHCELHDGTYYIPADTWSTERGWFSFVGWCGAIGFGLSSMVFLGWSSHLYYVILKTSNENKRHETQTRLENARSQYVIYVSTLSINVLYLYSSVINKLAAFGMWSHISATSVMNSKIDMAVEASLEKDNWDEAFVPDLSELWKYEVPMDPNNLGQLVHNVTVFCVLTMLKNVMYAFIISFTDDLHVISLVFAVVPSGLIVLFTWVPYLASFYCFHEIMDYYAQDFDFSFNSDLKTACFGGIMFGMGMLVQISSLANSAIQTANAAYENDLKKKRKESGDDTYDPEVFDCTWCKLVCTLTQAFSFPACFIAGLGGIIGLSCLGSVVQSLDRGGESFRLICVLWACCQASLCLFTCAAMRNSESIAETMQKAGEQAEDSGGTGV